MEDRIITIDDVRRTGHCVRGIKTWAKTRQLDFADFLKNGIAESILIETGDAIALDIVAKVRVNDGR